MYKYKFKKGNITIEGTGCNLFSGAENCGLTITRADFLSKWYLQDTKFEDRVRTVWCMKKGDTSADMYEVSQSYNK